MLAGGGAAVAWSKSGPGPPRWTGTMLRLRAGAGLAAMMAASSGRPLDRGRFAPGGRAAKIGTMPLAQQIACGASCRPVEVEVLVWWDARGLYTRRLRR